MTKVLVLSIVLTVAGCGTNESSTKVDESTYEAWRARISKPIGVGQVATPEESAAIVRAIIEQSANSVHGQLRFRDYNRPEYEARYDTLILQAARVDGKKAVCHYLVPRKVEQFPTGYYAAELVMEDGQWQVSETWRR